MACRAVERWTLSSLVGAYLDLALAYLILTGATAAFFASKLLSLFGLSLPCSCDGHFGHPACAQTALLLDFPSSRLAAVHRSLRSRFPFDSLLPGCGEDTGSPRCRYAFRFPSDDGDGDGGSCCSASSLSRPSRSLSLPAPQDPSLRQRPRPSLADMEKSSSTSAERSSGCPWNSDEEEGTTGLEEEAAAGEEGSCSEIGGVRGCNEGEKLDMIRRLERELEEDRGARAALYLELEKERNASASAADEAMAMILRLQKEKAEIDMEARQYRRVVEEKSAYDEEEMEILKEIIVRREREKLVFEKEVEMYKQMFNSGERDEQEFDIDWNFLEEKVTPLADSLDDPMLMLQQIYKSIMKKETSDGFGVQSSSMQNTSGLHSNQSNSIQNFVDVRKHVELVNNVDECDQEFQEKSMLSTQINPSSSNILNSSSAEDSILYNLNSTCDDEYHNGIAELDVKVEGEGGILFDIEVPAEGLCRMGSDDADQRCSESSQAETVSSVHDVHVIDDGQVAQVEKNSKQNSIAPEEEFSGTNFDEMELNIRRSCSEITNRMSLIDSLSGRASYFGVRSSLPSVESERCKLANEVEILRNRLEIIRQGRENLTLYAEQKEKDTFQLQLLDEIACQLKEIKKVTEPTKSLRQTSLPSPFSKCDGSELDACDSGCNGGLMTTAFEYLLKSGGLETEKDYPYTGTDRGGCRFDKGKVAASVSNFSVVSVDEDQIAANLVKHGPLAVAINAAFMQTYVHGVSCPYICSRHQNHGVLLVGYGSTGYAPIRFKGKPYWVIKNSWGQNWGDHGYYKICKGRNICGVEAMVSTVTATDTVHRS